MTKTRPPPIQRQRPCELRIDIESCPSSSCSIDLPEASEHSPIDPNSLSPMYPMLHSATTNGICSEDNSPGRCGSAASGDAASTAGSGRCSHSGSGCGDRDRDASGRGRGVRADARRRRSLWAAAQALQQLRKARERRGGRRGSFTPLSMLRDAAFSFSGGSGNQVPAVNNASIAHHLTAPDWRPGRVQLIANRSASQDRRDRGRREREECKKMALACYAVVCCVGAYALFSYVAFFMNG